ncbi:MAG: PASTA domain-containing protein [Anaerolineales bacterium]|nr:PASTA domain-containing protein [Anaerolineales bacterium]
MRKPLQSVCVLVIFFGLTLTGCTVLQESSPTATRTAPQPTSTETPTITPTVPSPTPVPTDTPTPPPTPTPSPQPTTTPTLTPIPVGFKVVPDVVGMHHSEARALILSGGLTFIYRDIYDRDQPFGTIVEQEPPAGSVIPENKFVILYRTFQAPGMWVGEACMPLTLTSKSGKLLFAVWLEEGEEYEIRTDFRFGETSISDSLMILLHDIENDREDHLFFTPEWTGWYVITLGPYRISQSQLNSHPEGVSAGCLWVYPTTEE